MTESLNEPLMFTAVDAVVLERHRQHEKWGHQRHQMEEWLVILMEEIGEFAQAIQRAKGQGKDTDQENKLEEAIHITAVAMHMVEQLIEEAEVTEEVEGAVEIDEPEEFPFEGFEENQGQGETGGEGSEETDS